MGYQQSRSRYLVCAASVVMASAILPVQAAEGDKSFEIYGFAQADFIQDFKRVNPNWDDTLRPSRIPTTEGEFGGDGQSIIGVRQSRFGVKADFPTGGKTLKTKFEIDLFGVGVDEGQTTIRLRHAYGEWGQWLAGQTHSLFMDIDVFPNTIDYWGPSGMVFLRNPQIRWTPISGANTFAVAIEKPSDDIDAGEFRTVDPGLLELQSDEELPDLTAQFRAQRDWGHVQVGGILRKIGVENIADPANITEDDDLGWGLNLSSNIKVGARDVVRLSIVYGEGIASYMNDGGVDLAPSTADPATADAESVELTGLVLYYDHWWSDQFSSSIGYSSTEVDNLDGQSPDAFKKGQYASANLLYYPADRIMVGAEFLWGDREDFNGASGDDIRLQISFKYNFGIVL
jgi:hypothetical protein